LLLRLRYRLLGRGIELEEDVLDGGIAKLTIEIQSRFDGSGSETLGSDARAGFVAPQTRGLRQIGEPRGQREPRIEIGREPTLHSERMKKASYLPDIGWHRHLEQRMHEGLVDARVEFGKLRDRLERDLVAAIIFLQLPEIFHAALGQGDLVTARF